MMKKILCVIALLLLLSSCGKSSIEVEKDVESEQDTVVVSKTEAPADTIENTDLISVSDSASDDIPADDNTESNESDNLNFPEETEIAEEESVLDPTLEVELNDLYEAAVDWGYTKNWGTVFSENHYLMCCTDTAGQEMFRELAGYNKNWFFSENVVVADRKCIAWLYFGHKFSEISPGQILEDLLEVNPSVVTFHEESIFDCYEKGYYEFAYKGDVYCFMKRDYHFLYMEEGEMTECTDVLIRMEGEGIPSGQIEAVSENLPSNEKDGEFYGAGLCDDILEYIDNQILFNCLQLQGQNIGYLAENGIITQVRKDVSVYCQFEGMDIKILGDRDGANVDTVCVPMSEIFTGDETWDHNRIKELFGGGFTFAWYNTYSKQNPYIYYFETSTDLSVILAANSDSTLDMDGWCAIR